MLPAPVEPCSSGRHGSARPTSKSAQAASRLQPAARILFGLQNFRTPHPATLRGTARRGPGQQECTYLDIKASPSAARRPAPPSRTDAPVNQTTKSARRSGLHDLHGWSTSIARVTVRASARPAAGSALPCPQPHRAPPGDFRLVFSSDAPFHV